MPSDQVRMSGERRERGALSRLLLGVASTAPPSHARADLTALFFCMKYLRSFFKDPFMCVSVLLGGSMLLLSAFLAYRAFSGLEYLLILHFGGGSGVDFLGTGRDVAWFFAIGFVAFAVNVGMGYVLFRIAPILARILLGFTVWLSFLIFFATAVMIHVNS